MDSKFGSERQSPPTAAAEPAPAHHETAEPQPLGATPCSALVSVLQGVGDALKSGFETQGFPCDVEPRPHGFKLWIGGYINASMNIGARGDTEKPEICVGALERGENIAATKAHFAKLRKNLKDPLVAGDAAPHAEVEQCVVV